MKKLSKKPTFIIIFVVVISVILYAIFGGSGAVPVSDNVIVKKGEVIQEVSVTGVVKPAQSVDLGFEKSGTIARVYAQVGDTVGAGQMLVALQSSESSAQLNQADADVKVAQAKLAELKAGTRPESLDIQSVKVAGATSALEDAKKNLADKQAEAYTKADEAVRNSVDQFFTNPRSSSPKILFQVNNTQLQIDVEWQRFLVEDLLINWKTENASVNLSIVKFFLDKVWLALNTAATDASVSQSDIIGWKAAVFISQTNINTAIANVTSAVEKLKAAESDLALAQSQLTLDRAGTVSDQIIGQEAQVEKAIANRDYYASLLGKSVLRSPISGVVTKQDAKVGEIASANSMLISLISSRQYEIEANIPEADIAKVKIGDSAKVSLDAYGSDTFFDANVVSIDPAETMIDGVATYKVKFQFAKPDERIRSGMTANIDISTDSRTNVLIVPSRAIATKSGRKVVQVISGKIQTEIEVKTGLRGSDGNVEILEGLTEGQEVKITVQ